MDVGKVEGVARELDKAVRGSSGKVRILITGNLPDQVCRNLRRMVVVSGRHSWQLAGFSEICV